jgi:hypothetical protein
MKRLFFLMLGAHFLFSSSSNDYWCTLKQVPDALPTTKVPEEWQLGVSIGMDTTGRPTRHASLDCSKVFDYKNRAAACLYKDDNFEQYQIGYYRGETWNKPENYSTPHNSIIKPRPLYLGVNENMIFYLSIEGHKALKCHVLEIL